VDWKLVLNVLLGKQHSVKMDQRWQGRSQVGGTSGKTICCGGTRPLGWGGGEPATVRKGRGVGTGGGGEPELAGRGDEKGAIKDWEKQVRSDKGCLYRCG